MFTTHDTRRLPIGKAVELREERAGLRVAFEVADTTAGRDALELVRSGTVDAFSIGFAVSASAWTATSSCGTEAALMEVSLVGLPAYEGATVAGVRSQLVIPRAVAEARLSLLDW